MAEPELKKRILLIKKQKAGGRAIWRALEKVQEIEPVGPVDYSDTTAWLEAPSPDLIIIVASGGKAGAASALAAEIQKHRPIPIIFSGASELLAQLEKKTGDNLFLGLPSRFSERELRNTINLGLYAAKVISPPPEPDESGHKAWDFFQEVIEALDTVLARIPDAVIVHDRDGSIKRVNASGSRLLNLAPEQAVGKKCFKLSGRLLPCPQCQAAACLDDHRPTREEKYLPDTDQWLDCRVFPILDSQGRIFRIVEHIRDITDMKSAELQLKENESRFRSIVANSHDGIVIIGDDYRFNYVNDELCRMVDYTADELIGCDFRDFLAEETKDYTIRNFTARREGGYPPVRYEFLVLRKDGSRRWVETSSAVVTMPDGGKQTVSQLLDISERKLAEEALREKQAYNKLLFESHRTAMVVMDPETSRFLDCNPAAARIYGFSSKEELIGKTPLDVSFPYQYDDVPTPQKARMYIDKCLELGSMEFEWLHQRQDGVLWDGAVHLMAFQSGGRDLIQFSVQDITQRKQTEKDLRDKKRELESFFNCALEMLCIGDRQGRFKLLNQEWTNVLGYETSELEGTYFLDLVHPDDKESTVEAVKAFELDHPILVHVNRNRCKDGSYRWLEWRSYPFGDVVYAAARDITERKQAEEEMSAQKAFLQQIIDADPNFIFVKDRESRFVLVNKAVAEAYGASSPDDLIGKSDADFSLYPDEIDHFHDDDLEVIDQKNEKFIPEEKLTSPNGKTRWLQTSKRPLIDADGGCTKLLGVSSDITGRKLAEEELRRLRNFLSNIIDSMPSILVGVKPDGRVMQWNRRAEQETGIPAQRAAGKEVGKLIPRLEPLMEKVRAAVNERMVQHETSRIGGTEPDSKIEDITIYPLTANGVVGAVIRIDDVTDRVRLEEMMIQSEKMLSVGGLAAGMAHEINNPLAGIMQNAQMLGKRLAGDIPANHRAAEIAGTDMDAIRSYIKARGLVNMLDNINESGRRAASIVKNMLSFARGGENAAKLENPVEIVENTLELARTDYNLKKNYDFKRIEIIKEFDSAIPDIPCEKSKIQQVLLNILKNGAEAMSQELAEGQTSPRLIIRIKKMEKQINIEVEDNGPGMDEKTLKRIFEPFFTTKPVGKGTGLGLSVSYFIITENHGGSLIVKSRLGGGSNFIVSLPVGRTKELLP